MTARPGTPEASRLLVQRRSQRERGVVPTEPPSDTHLSADTCRKCGGPSTVGETRRVRGGLRRRRKCIDPRCGMRWTTNERRVSEDIDEMEAFDPCI